MNLPLRSAVCNSSLISDSGAVLSKSEEEKGTTYLHASMVAWPIGHVCVHAALRCSTLARWHVGHVLFFESKRSPHGAPAPLSSGAGKKAPWEYVKHRRAQCAFRARLLSSDFLEGGISQLHTSPHLCQTRKGALSTGKKPENALGNRSCPCRHWCKWVPPYSTKLGSRFPMLF